MRVALFNHNIAWTGGTFVRCLYLARGLTKKGHLATLVTTSPRARLSRSETVREGVRVIEMPALLSGRVRSGWDLWDVTRRLLLTISQEQRSVDIVHSFDCRPAAVLPALLLSRMAEAPLVIDWADWWGRGGTIESRETSALTRTAVRGVETWFEESFRTQAQRTTVISTALAERAARLGVHSETITVLPSGSDVTGITPLSIPAARGRRGLPPDIPIVGYLGTILREDLPLLLEVLDQLLQHNRNVRLLLVGNPNIAIPDREEIIRTGFVENRGAMAELLASCNVLLLPLADTIANRGRWPSKINDYMAVGRPIAATPVGDVSGLISGRGIGAVGRVDDGSFTAGVLKILSDGAEAKRIGRRARKVAEHEFSWSQIVDRLLDVYAQACSGGATRSAC